MANSRSKCRRIIAVTWSRLNGDITQAELVKRVADIQADQEQLPLGVGAIMPTEEAPR